MNLICECGHVRCDHGTELQCNVVMCKCVGFTLKGEKGVGIKVGNEVNISTRYRVLKAGGVYTVVDQTVDTAICYCVSSEVADAIMGAMNYIDDCNKAQVALTNMEIEI